MLTEKNGDVFNTYFTPLHKVERSYTQDKRCPLEITEMFVSTVNMYTLPNNNLFRFYAEYIQQVNISEFNTRVNDREPVLLKHWV